MEVKNIKGITLIALVITIIVLLILAGVTIATLTGENGILNKAEISKVTTEEETAKEKLNLILTELGIDKKTDSKYNENEFIDDRINKNQMTVLENDMVLVDGWVFLIDRTIPTIVESLGKEELLDTIQNLYIYNAKQLVKFRDNVKNGETYEGKVVTVKNDIDMSKVCYKVDGTPQNDVSWEPIPSNFKGTFNGDGHEIKNLYINTNSDFQGLFRNNYGIIENLGIDEKSIIKGTNHSGAIVGCNMTTGIIKKCYNKATVMASRDVWCITGGLVGQNEGLVTMCYNEGKVQAESKNDWAQTGGVVGLNYNNSELSKCYNKGEIISIAKENWSNAGGVVGVSYEKDVVIKDCYNRGTIRMKTTGYQSDLRVGGVVGDMAETDFSNADNIGDIIVEDSFGSHIQIGGALRLHTKKFNS